MYVHACVLCICACACVCVVVMHVCVCMHVCMRVTGYDFYVCNSKLALIFHHHMVAVHIN